MQNFDSKKYYEETLQIIRDLCAIPAPSGMEENRAKYVLDYIKKAGYEDAYIDQAKNVIWKIDGQVEDCALFCAHTDTVFPDLTPMPMIEDDVYMRCPGVCDDTASVAILMVISKVLKENNHKPYRTLLMSANACEEGLGDLKGIKQIFKDLGSKIKAMCTFDNRYSSIINKSVGSHRYKITAITEGGHSFGKFGSRNAINVLAKIVTEIYKIEVPKKDNLKTTYNVGTIEGGTSVNTIAQNAVMYCEYRSEDRECLAYMEKKFNEIFDSAKNDCIELKVELVGNRPCMGDVDEAELRRITDKVKAVQAKYTGLNVVECCASTDCNIPHSLGIPAVDSGVWMGQGSHTREEYLEKASILPGLSIAYEVILGEL